MIADYKMGDAPPPGKPSWDDAPEWANSLGVATWDCGYKGEWCWCATTKPAHFDHVEQRP